MNDRDEDWLLVERAQRGEKHAFDLLVTKYQRKLRRTIGQVPEESCRSR